MKPRTYRALCFLEIMLVVVFFFALTVPTPDYARREFGEYLRHPSAQTLQAFYDKKQEEVRLCERIAALIGLVAVALAIPIFRNRRSKTNSKS
jgi:hypothetical protein